MSQFFVLAFSYATAVTMSVNSWSTPPTRTEASDLRASSMRSFSTSHLGDSGQKNMATMMYRGIGIWTKSGIRHCQSPKSESVFCEPYAAQYTRNAPMVNHTADNAVSSRVSKGL